MHINEIHNILPLFALNLGSFFPCVNSSLSCLNVSFSCDFCSLKKVSEIILFYRMSVFLVGVSSLLGFRLSIIFALSMCYLGIGGNIFFLSFFGSGNLGKTM